MIVPYLILAILIFLPAYLLRFSIAGIPTTALEIAIYLAVICYLLSVHFGKAKWHLPERRWLLPISLFVVGALIGVLVSPDKRIALGQFKGFIFDPILLGLVLYSALRSQLVNQSQLVAALVIGGLLVSASVLLGFKDQDGRLLGIYGFDPTASPNFLALFLGPIIILAIAGLRTHFARIVAAAVMLASLFWVGSRGVFVGIGLGAWWLIQHWFKKPVLYLIPAALLILTGFLARPDLSARPDSGRISTSNNIRYEIWKTTTEMLTEKSQNFVFGIGLGNYQRYFTELTRDRVNYPEFIAPKALTPHNIFLAMWTNGGLVMLGAFVWLLVLAVRSKGALPAQAALVTLVGHGLVDTPYFKNDLSVLFWVLIVLTMIGERKT